MKTGEVFAPYLLHKIIWSIGLFVCFHAHGQEICNNGKDDDGDGLVDLHDPDCQCHWNSNVNLLKNASFESYIKCEVEPYTNANDANVIDNWTYATFLYGNPNYYHNFSCHEDSAAMMYAMPPKLPLPDGGRAYVTISQDGSNLADAQEQRMNKYYLAQVLAAPLSKGVDYTLTFYAGKFHDRDDPNFFVDSFGVGIFGSTDTAVLPFGVPSQGNGCPANYAGWYALGKATLYSKGYWVEGRISFTPPANIRLFSIGPDCSIIRPRDSGTHQDFSTFFLDDLQLARTETFHFQPAHVLSGDACSGNYVLAAPASGSYQWYRDSIALPGQSDSLLHVPEPSTSAFYNVKISNGGECLVSDPVFLPRSLLGSLSFPADTTGCSGDTLLLRGGTAGVDYRWNGSSDSVVRLTVSGLYAIQAEDTYGCSREVEVKANFIDCNACGCLVPNAFTPNGDGKNDYFHVHINCPLQEFHLEVFNRWGRLVFQSNALDRGWDGRSRGKKLPAGVYVYFLRYKPSRGAAGLSVVKGTVALCE